jgi:hypothetical protein
MHGLVNRSIEGFLRSSYGPEVWQAVANSAGVDAEGFLTWTTTADQVVTAMLRATAQRLRKPVGECLEDIGAWLTRQEEIRRLLRFSGSDYPEFLESLRELPGRIALVIPEMAIPGLTVTCDSSGCYAIYPSRRWAGFLRVTAGVIRGMADDYGALALISVQRGRIVVNVALNDYAMQRCFSLAPDAEDAEDAANAR